MTIYTKLPPKILMPLLYIITAVGLFIRYILGTIGGVFLATVISYYYLTHFGDTRPFSPLELLNWACDLDKEYKIAMLSSFITIIGFIIAFHTASLNWQSKMRAELKLQVSNEIEEFFSQISRDITSASIYAELLVNSVKEIKLHGHQDNAVFKIQYIQQQSSAFIATRERLVRDSIEIHRLLGRNSNILSAGWTLIDSFKSATEAFERITDKMWLVVPIVDIQNPNCISIFLNSVDVSKCVQRW